MKLLVTGASGKMAWPALVHILEQEDVTEVMLCDINQEGLDKRVAVLGNDPRLKTKVLDLFDIEAAAEAFKGYDCILNMAYCPATLPGCKAALLAGVNYTDMGSFETDKQFLLNDGFVAIGKTAALGVGTAVGMTYFMPDVVARGMERVDSVEALDVCKNLVPHSENTFPIHWGYSFDTILDEFFFDGEVVINGKIEQVPPRSLPESYNFLPPTGPSTVAVTYHPEVPVWYDSWKDKGLKYAVWKIGYEDEFEQKMRFLVKLGMADPDKRVIVNGVEVCPRDVLLATIASLPPESGTQPDFRGHMVIKVKGVENGVPVSYTITEYATNELTAKMQSKGIFSSYRTGLYGAVAALMLARNEAIAKGALYPHDCISSRDYIKNVIAMGIDVTYEKIELLEL